MVGKRNPCQTSSMQTTPDSVYPRYEGSLSEARL